MPQAPTHLLVRQMLDESGWTAQNRANATSALNHWCAWLEHCDVELEAATIAHTRGYLDELGAHLAPATVQVRWRMLRALYRWLEDEELLARKARSSAGPANPMHNVKAPRVASNPRTAATSEADYHRLVNHWPRNTETGTRNAAMVSLMYRTGLRVGELGPLRLEHYDAARQQVLVPKTKTDTVRRVPVHTETARLIRRYLRYRGTEPGPLFRGTNGTVDATGQLRVQAIRDCIKRACRSAGVTTSPHAFRRAFATNYLANGGNAPMLKAIAGWSTDAMVTRYMGARAEDVADIEYRRIMDADPDAGRPRRQPRRLRALS